MRPHVNSILCASRRWRLPHTEMTDMIAALFRPFDLAGTALRNRIAMAPMTRARRPGRSPTNSPRSTTGSAPAPA
jgi:hypothetical protein